MSISRLKNPRHLVLALVSRLINGKIPSVSSVLSGSEIRLRIDGRGTVSAGNSWDSRIVDIVKEIERAPMSFLRQPVISRAVHPNQQDLARHYLNELLTQPFFREHILPRLHEVPMGDPYLCTFFPFASPATIQNAYFLSLMKEKFGIFPPDGGIKHFLEIGGGYGNFCRIVKDFGYSGRYVIADLPEMHALQRHFLAHALPERSASNGIEFRALTDVGILPEQGPSLLLATFSLSEMPLETRRTLEPQYSRFDYLFFVYNLSFDGIDNIA